MSIQTEDVQITTQSGAKMGAYLARPDSPGRKPAVIVFMEIFGVNDHIRDVTRRVAAEGFIAPGDAAAAVHAFHALQGIRLAVQANHSLDGKPSGNQLDPDRLNEFDRRVLLESLRQARKLQQHLKTRFHVQT